MMRHPRFLKNQVRQEIAMSVKGFWVLDLMTLPWFLGECRGYSKMYEGIENSPFGNGKWGGIAYIVAR
jgi:lathosterol oxidase